MSWDGHVAGAIVVAFVLRSSSFTWGDVRITAVTVTSAEGAPSEPGAEVPCLSSASRLRRCTPSLLALLVLVLSTSTVGLVMALADVVAMTLELELFVLADAVLVALASFPSISRGCGAMYRGCSIGGIMP